MQLTVGDALLLLSKYPKDLRIMVEGYEEGFDDPEIHQHFVVPVKENEEWNGKYMPYKMGGGPVNGVINALVLHRRTYNQKPSNNSL